MNPPGQRAVRDDGPREELKTSVRRSLDYYKNLPSDKTYVFGSHSFTVSRLQDTLETFLGLLDLPEEDFQRELNRRFDFYASPGTDGNGSVRFSAYYEHTLPASLRRTDEYRYPIYSRPTDLKEGRPYHTREAIDSRGALQGKGLEIAWARDPLDIYYLQVEGSGWLVLPDEPKPVRIRYAGNNGHPYRSIGLYLIEKGLIPKKDFNRHVMEAYIEAHPEERQTIINYNPRYVFFSLDRGPRSQDTLGSLRLPLTPWRSVATDPAVFPPGSLSWMEVDGETPVTRFVVSQDEGGAIKGPGRVDYFVGAAEGAEDYAARFWRTGRFYLLLKKAEGKP